MIALSPMAFLHALMLWGILFPQQNFSSCVGNSFSLSLLYQIIGDTHFPKLKFKRPNFIGCCGSMNANFSISSSAPVASRVFMLHPRYTNRRSWRRHVTCVMWLELHIRQLILIIYRTWHLLMVSSTFLEDCKSHVVIDHKVAWQWVDIAFPGIDALGMSLCSTSPDGFWVYSLCPYSIK